MQQEVKNTIKLAFNLLRSYKLHSLSSRDLPFEIICDRRNEYTDEFDVTVILEDASRSFMYKLLSLYGNSPFEETIFIDVDTLFIALEIVFLLWNTTCIRFCKWMVYI